MDDLTLKKLQNLEFEMLCDIDQYCRENGIKYSLYAGTMLGAVRHNGFIPWDDDVDITMIRSEYTKFCQCISMKPLNGYVFSNYENDRYIQACHGKLGKLGTVFVQHGDIESVGHHEIWIDIFPLDKLSSVKPQREETKKIGRELVLLTRANGKRDDPDFKKRIVRRIFKLYPGRYRRMIKDAEKLRKLDQELVDNYEWTSMSTLENIEKIRFPKEMLEDYTELDFNGKRFMSFADYDGMLKLIYGDYMKLPPEQERVFRHSPVRIEF